MIPSSPQLKRRQSDYIRQVPARNLHHAIRLAESKNLPLNVFVSINFSFTTCPDEQVDRALQSIRNAFGKWITRPGRQTGLSSALPAFVWVIENKDGCLNAHWLVHVPAARHRDFVSRLYAWLEQAVGAIKDNRALHIQEAVNPRGLGRYMLKGMYPSLARYFEINSEYQGWVTGRRIGHSKSLGPVEAARMRDKGLHPRAQRWRVGKYKRESSALGDLRIDQVSELRC